MSTGIAFINGLGIQNVANWGTITIFCIAPAICSILVMYFMPESPFYLVSKNRESEAFESLVWLRGNTNEITSEMDNLKKSIGELNTNSNFSYKKLLTEKVYFKPFIIAIALMFAQQFSGIGVSTYYRKDIFLHAGSQIDAGLSAFIIAMVEVSTRESFQMRCCAL